MAQGNILRFQVGDKKGVVDHLNEVVDRVNADRGGPGPRGVGRIWQIPFLITGATAITADRQWRYKGKRATKVLAGYASAWDVTGETEVDNLWNGAEVGNSATPGVQGNGVDTSAALWTDHTFVLKPITAGTVVFCLWVETVTGAGAAAVEFWFHVPNGVGGTC